MRDASLPPPRLSPHPLHSAPCTLHPLHARLSFAEDKNEKSEESIFDTARSSLKGIDTNAFANFMTTGPMLDASKISHQIFESSIPGKVSFGFAM